MIRIRPTLLALAGLLCAAPAAAQTFPGAFTIPTGSYEYRWLVRVNADSSVERTPASGYLRLHENGRFAHSRDAEGKLFSRQGGGFDADGNLLFISNPPAPGRLSMPTDTFVVRPIGGRLYLWQDLHENGWQEYELAPRGGPGGRPDVPGVVPDVYAFVAEILYFEDAGQPVPRAQRRFATRFASASTRYLYVQLQLAFPILQQPHDFRLDCRVRDAAGQEVHRREYTSSGQPGDVYRYIWFGWGADEPGSVPPGTYRVGCTVDGVEMMQGSVQVT